MEETFPLCERTAAVPPRRRTILPDKTFPGQMAISQRNAVEEHGKKPARSGLTSVKWDNRGELIIQDSAKSASHCKKMPRFHG
jgi:hypothetical protein